MLGLLFILFIFAPYFILTIGVMIMNKDDLIALQEEAKELARQRVLEKLTESYERRMIDGIKELMKHDD